MAIGDPVPIRLLRGQVINDEGDVLVEQPVTKKRKTARKQKRMSMMNVDAFTRLECTNLEYRVLFCLIAHVPSRSGTVAFVQINQIAEETGIHRVDVSKTMKSLRGRRIIRTLRQGQHHINANIVFSGSFDDWNEADTEELEPIWHRHGADPVTGEIR